MERASKETRILHTCPRVRIWAGTLKKSRDNPDSLGINLTLDKNSRCALYLRLRRERKATG